MWPRQQPLVSIVLAVVPNRICGRLTAGFLGSPAQPLTRDAWMHRTDVAAATGREMKLTTDHDAVIVDDVAREWAHRHGQPCTLTLTGSVGRHYVFGPGGTIKFSNAPHRPRPGSASPAEGPSYTRDAIEFCRNLSGRGFGDGLLQTRVPF